MIKYVEKYRPNEICNIISHTHILNTQILYGPLSIIKLLVSLLVVNICMLYFLIK